LTCLPAGHACGMAQDDDVPTTGGLTGPQTDTKDATAPPGNPDSDQAAVAKAEDDLEQAGGGH
jgi:hypothetical protein